MATPSCPKCDNTTFEMKEIEPYDSKFKYNTIQCRSCGAVVGVTDYYNTASLLKKIADKFGIKLF